MNEGNPIAAAGGDDAQGGGFSLNTYLPYHLTFPVGTIARVLGGAMEARFGLRSTHWRIVALLGSHGPVSTRELSRYLSSERSAISRATTDLIKLGYVLRVIHPLDRRLLMLHLSASGKRLFQRMGELALEFEAALLKHVSRDEILVVEAALQKLRAAALEYQSTIKRSTRRTGTLKGVGRRRVSGTG